ncbi:MAG: DUF881 domain-containing protein [Clostridia bacterium]|jgi:uncharacterized protein YlxW (UPF0749 family)
MSKKMITNISLAMVLLLLGCVISLQFKSTSNNKQIAAYDNKRTDELKDELIQEKKNNEILTDKNNELQKEITAYESKQGGEDTVLLNMRKELLKAKLLGGLIAVKGKGITVTIDNTAVYFVEDLDILKVLNELRASGAQAMSVNNERIIATSEIRTAGNYIMVNGRQLIAPFEIKAIADPDELENSLKIIGGIVEELQAYFKVTVSKSDEITIPKIRDDSTSLNTNMLTPVDN